MAVEEVFGRYDETRCAVSALLGVVVYEGGGHGRQLASGRGGDSFQGFDPAALCVDGEDGTAIHDLAVDDYGACSAGAAVADAFGGGEIEAMAQGVAEGGARLDLCVI